MPAFKSSGLPRRVVSQISVEAEAGLTDIRRENSSRTWWYSPGRDQNCGMMLFFEGIHLSGVIVLLGAS